jgi:hypothetical protein
MLLSLQAVAFVMLVILPPQLIFLSMIFIGLGFGIEADYIPYLISRAFGLRAYAAIFGAMMSFAGTLSMFGPFIYARLEEVTGNYAVAFSLAGTFALCASVMLALAALTVRPARSASFAS